MSLMDFTLPASDPNNPNAIIPPDAIKQRRMLAAALMKQGSDTSPIRSPWQGAARIAQTLQGLVTDYSADRDQMSGERSARDQMAALLSGEGPAATPSTSPSSASTIPADVNPLITDTAKKYGLDPAYMTKVAALESSGNPSAANGNSSAKGLFQFIDSTAKQYGLTNPMDPAANADAAARFTMDNKAALAKALGRDPTPGELYLAHQQGAGGAAKLLGNPDAPAASLVGADAIANNGGTPGMTAKDFAQKWTGRFDTPQSAPRGFDRAKAIAILSNPHASVAAQQIASALLKQGFERTDIEKKLDAAGVTDPAERSRIIKNDIEGSENWDVKTIPNADGSTTAVKVNKNTGEIVPVDLPKSEASAAIEQGVTGDEFLKTLDPRSRDIIKKVANYEIDPRTLSIKGGHREDILSKVARYDPDYDQANYASRAAALKEFNSGGPNAPASAITSGNTYIQHLKTLSDASQKIGGTNNAWILNKPINWLNANVESMKNNPDLVEYKKALDRVVEEGTKFYRGVGGNEADIQRTIEALTPGQSPEARNRAISTEAELIHGKVNALQSRFQTALGASAWKKAIERTGPDFPIIQKKSADALEAIRARNRGETPKEAKPERITKSINGKNYYQENGQWFEE